MLKESGVNLPENDPLRVSLNAMQELSLVDAQLNNLKTSITEVEDLIVGAGEKLKELEDLLKENSKSLSDPEFSKIIFEAREAAGELSESKSGFLLIKERVEKNLKRLQEANYSVEHYLLSKDKSSGEYKEN